MTLLQINGVYYNYETGGDGLPLLLLHGFTGSLRNWESLIPALTKQGIQTIRVDLLGHGGSDAPDDPDRYRMENVAADLAALIAHLNVQTVNLLGYSMGGRLALYFAWRFPEMVSSLILESASPGLATPLERKERMEADARLAEWIESHSMAEFVERWEALPMWASQANLPADRLAQQRAQRLDNRQTGLANSLRGMGTGAQPSLWEHLDEVACPVYMICGTLDEKYSQIATRLHEHLPHSTIASIPDCGHNTHLERPASFLNHIIQSLRDPGD